MKSPRDNAVSGKCSGQMQEIFTVVRKLREEKAALETELSLMSQRTEAEEKRFIRDLGKSRIDLANLADLFRHCADGIDTKSTANIPELPEAAVAKVMPRGLLPLLEHDYVEDRNGSVSLAQEIGATRKAVLDSSKEYERMAEAGTGLIWDVDRLNMIIAAYETDLITLREEGSETKAFINQNRLKWRMKFSACRRWQDFTRRSHLLKFQNELDKIQDAFDLEQATTEEELQRLLDMIGITRVKDNKAKLTLFMKKMKNAVMYKVWRGWVVFHQLCQQEKFGLEMDELARLEAEKLAAMKNKETAAMLRCFIKRWQNRKLAVPFMTWADIVIANREARLLAELEAERARLLARMQALEGSAVAEKLKLIFAKIAGKMKDLTFRALVKNMQMGRIARMGEDERFKRLKVFLENKLKGVKFSTFKCLEREARAQKTGRIKGNAMAQKVAAFLEMKIKGIKFAIFSAFKRHAKDSALENAEKERLARLIAERDSQSLQRLKIFLQGKEMRLKYAFFSFWTQCMAGSTEFRMRELLAEKRKKRQALESQLRDLERQLGGRGSGDLEAQIADAEAQLREAQRRGAALNQDLAAAQQRLQEQNRIYTAEQNARRGDKATIKDLEQDLEDAISEKQELAEELSVIHGQIGYLNEYSK